ncbi:DUF3048 domain-containing protein [Nocardia carnea]|uniref:DUF3048 domain-containing protein n=1 Tax=Nocardia carnea TaxID=37328 RepID=UPI003D783E79
MLPGWGARAGRECGQQFGGWPPVGLAAADVVDVEPVEGGVSRLATVFSADKPPVIGPVRSARETDLTLLTQFGNPVPASSGAHPSWSQPSTDLIYRTHRPSGCLRCVSVMPGTDTWGRTSSATAADISSTRHRIRLGHSIRHAPSTSIDYAVARSSPLSTVAHKGEQH